MLQRTPAGKDISFRQADKMIMFTKIAVLALGIVAPTVGATKASLLEGTCEYNTYMCCWSRNDNGVADNTDVCGPPLERRRLGASSDGGMVSHESTYMLDMEDDYDDEDNRRMSGLRGERDMSEKVGMEEEEDDRFAAGDEGDIHCHGFVWADGAHFESFILPLYKFVKSFDHRHARGYYGRCVRWLYANEPRMPRVASTSEQP